MANCKTFVILVFIWLSIILIECKQMKRNDDSIQMDVSGRQLTLWPFNKGLSRQIFDMFDIITDVAMLTFLGVPLLGLVALGASVIAPSLNTERDYMRTKRSGDHSMLSRTKRALLYARNLFDILANLEEAFRKYEIIESECQLKAVCEVHKKQSLFTHKYSTFGHEISNLIRMQNDLEEYEIIPLAKIIFNQYTDAATYGNEDNDCDLIYSRCSHNLQDFLNKNNKRLNPE